MMKKNLSFFFTILLLWSISACQNSVEKPVDTTMELVWSDEFDYKGKPDPEKWDFDLGDGCPTLCGWGNNEKQFYTQNQKNVRVADGNLIIEAHKDREDSIIKYTSTRIVTKNKGDWKHGLIEVRARLPKGRGTWPAIWMLPTDWKYGDWPRSGEIDIMEHVGHDQGNVHGTVHTEAFNHIKGTQKGDSLMVASASEDFHTYAIKWTPSKIDFLIDGEIYNTFTNTGEGYEAWPFDQSFHLIMNIAVGGNWGGEKGVDDSIWPQRMEVDYVRVYQEVAEDEIAGEAIR